MLPAQFQSDHAPTSTLTRQNGAGVQQSQSLKKKPSPAPALASSKASHCCAQDNYKTERSISVTQGNL